MLYNFNQYFLWTNFGSEFNKQCNVTASNWYHGLFPLR